MSDRERAPVAPGTYPRCTLGALGVTALILLMLMLLLGAGCISPRDYPAVGAGDGDGGLLELDASRPGGAELFHPAGYAEASYHGPESNLQLSNCRDAECHGADLTGGGSNVSCDAAGCHGDDWRTDCVLCHGGTESAGGAPPKDMDGMMDAMQISFRAHTSHVTESNHAAFACTECHVDADRVLTPGHAFDDTPGRAEVTFAAGVSAAGVYEADGTCANLYCHGSGRVNGSSRHDDGAKACDGCHPDKASGLVRWAAMTGDHAIHLRVVGCVDCHGAVVDGSDTVIAPGKHVNGVVDLAMEAGGITYDAAQCNGFCHNHFHLFDVW